MLRPYPEALMADERYGNVMVPVDGGWRSMQFSDHYEMVAGVRLSVSVPDDIRRMFSRALSCALYAWFDYELTPLAEQQAYASLGAALRAYYSVEQSSLWNLVERAVADGVFEPALGNVPLKMALSTLRNEGAHGPINFGTPAMALTMIAYCARLIGQLYPEPAN